jgi:4-amino-4-deoxy-L-arabinose transferase-like glycosyltransferase
VTAVARPPRSVHDGRATGFVAERPRARTPAEAARTRGGQSRANKIMQYAPLVVILAVQAALTLRLIRWGYASGDEGRYIYDGHQLIYELWHGGGSPYYETFTSGAPVIYPVLAAMADYVGGLLAARLMSLVFMLVATCLLFGVSRRWFGYWPAVLAAGLFAGLGLTQALGALATFDAMSLMLTAAAAYCAARTADSERHAVRWLLATPLMLLAANATKYVSVLFDPVVIGIAVWQIREGGLKRMVQRVAALGLTTVILSGVALLVGGGAYIQGILYSTFSRQANDAAFAGTTTNQSGLPAKVVIHTSWDFIGAVLVLGLVALLLAMVSRRDRGYAWLLALLLAAGLLVTVEMVRLHSIESMTKHDDYGIWFTAVGAGAVVAWIRPRFAAIPVALALMLGSGYVYSRDALATVATYQATNNTAAAVQFLALKPYLELHGGRYLIGGFVDNNLVYLDKVPVMWWNLVDDNYIKYPIPGRGGDSHGEKQGLACTTLLPQCMYLEGVAGYRAAISAHWFALISMIGEHYTLQDVQIEKVTADTPGYVRLWQIPGPPTWIYAPDYPVHG